MSCGIYKITNLINNKCYIGQSIHIERRWQEHKQSANPANLSFDSTKHLYNAINKYGVNNFSFEIIEECEASMLDSLECRYIKQFNSADSLYGYNTQLGGRSGRTATPAYVLEVIFELKQTNETMNELAKRLCLNRRTIIRINSGESWPQENEVYPIRTFTIASLKAKHSTNSASSKHWKLHGKLSNDEYNKRRAETCCKPKYDWPSKEILANELYSTSFEAVGKKYNVSSNAIRKLCKKYNIPTHKKEFIEWYKMQQID